MNLPTPENRHEIFLASAAGMDVRKPEPITREEIYLNAIASGDDFDPDSYYTKSQTDARITEKVAEIVADAPEDFDTLKEMSDWIDSHEDSAAAMNSAIQQNTNAISGKVDKVSGKGLSTNDYTTEEKNKLSGIETGANKTVIDSALNSSSTNPVQNKVIKENLDNKVDKVAGKGLSTNDYTTAEKTKLAGLENYDDTAIYTALGDKVDKVNGKQLSTEDYTAAEKTKLAGIETGATKTTVDDTLNSESTNPVQNKTVYNKLLSIDTEIATIKEKFAKVELYGIKVEKNNSNPETRCTYMYDAVGFTPAGMQYNDNDIEASTFSYGSWDNAFFAKNNYPVMCNYDGSEDYKLSPSNHAYKEDGETASNISDTAYTGNAMSCFDCKIWIKMWEDDNFEYYAVSNYQLDEDYKDYPYIRADGTHADKLYYPMFKGSSVDSKLRSIAGTYPQNNATASTEVSLCSANGTDWQIGDWAHRTWLNVLLLLMGKNDDTQLVYGEGCTSGGADDASKKYGFPVNGSLMDKGQFYGYATAKSTTKAMKVFYIENWWGTRWDRCLGLWNDNGTYKIKWIPTYSVSAPDEDCLVMSGVTIPSAGYQKTMSNTYGRLCVATGGSASTYTCDYHYANNNATCLALVGGTAGNGSNAGAWYVNVYNAPSNSSWYFGASPYLKQPS